MARKRSGKQGELDEAFWKRVKAARRRNEKRARKLLARARHLEPGIEHDFYALGQTLNELSDKSVYAALGYPTFADCLRGEELTSKPTAYKLMAVARTFDADLAAELGFEKAYALIGWARERGRDPAKAARADSRIGGKRISELSVRQLVRHTQRLRRQSDAADPDERAAHRSAGLLLRALRARGARSVTVTAIKRRDGWHLRIDLRARDADRVT